MSTAKRYHVKNIVETCLSIVRVVMNLKNDYADSKKLRMLEHIHVSRSVPRHCAVRSMSIVETTCM